MKTMLVFGLTLLAFNLMFAQISLPSISLPILKNTQMAVEVDSNSEYKFTITHDKLKAEFALLPLNQQVFDQKIEQALKDINAQISEETDKLDIQTFISANHILTSLVSSIQFSQMAVNANLQGPDALKMCINKEVKIYSIDQNYRYRLDTTAFEYLRTLSNNESCITEMIEGGWGNFHSNNYSKDLCKNTALISAYKYANDIIEANLEKISDSLLTDWENKYANYSTAQKNFDFLDSLIKSIKDTLNEMKKDTIKLRNDSIYYAAQVAYYTHQYNDLNFTFGFVPATSLNQPAIKDLINRRLTLLYDQTSELQASIQDAQNNGQSSDILNTNITALLNSSRKCNFG